MRWSSPRWHLAFLHIEAINLKGVGSGNDIIQACMSSIINTQDKKMRQFTTQVILLVY